jgi:Ca2+-binding RTX toxin-like protein/alpha-tubulin suppressor-like RCC1 family protein
MAGIVELMNVRLNADGLVYHGTQGNDTISGNSFSNSIYVYDGDDSVFGGSGNDTIDGGSGNDQIKGGVGDDLIDGGTGADQVVFSGVFTDYVISFKKEGVVFTVRDTVGGRDGTDTLIGVESFEFADGTKTSGDAYKIVYGTSLGDDLYGNDLDNELYGSSGNDVLEGKKGNDTIYGGIGSDTVIYSGNYMDYNISHSAGSSIYIVMDLVDGRDGTDMLSNVENIRFADRTMSVGLLIDDSGNKGLDKPGIICMNSSNQMYQGHTMGEWLNVGAFAALREDGSVVTWGLSGFGGDCSAVSSQLNGAVPVVDVFSSWTAFAALRTDGSVVTWGDQSRGGDSSGVSSNLNGNIDVVNVYSTMAAFAALREDGSVVTWGAQSGGGDSSGVSSNLNGNIDVVNVYSTMAAFAALREDGSVVTWGIINGGGDSSIVSDKLDGRVNTLQISSTWAAFAALREDGSVVTWGLDSYGGNSNGVMDKLDGTIDVIQVVATTEAFAALREDGSVITWGDYTRGGYTAPLADKLNGTIEVKKIFASGYGFAALCADGSVLTWGATDNSHVKDDLDGRVDVVQIYSNYYGFAALREDGSVVTWGAYGTGDSSIVAEKLDGRIDVTNVFSTAGAFAALRVDGSVVTWGGGSDGGFYDGIFYDGGDSSMVADKLDGTIDVLRIYSTNSAFAALREDGSVVTWGYGEYGGDSSTVADKLHDVVTISDIYSNNTEDRIHEGSNDDDEIKGGYRDDLLWGNGGNDLLIAKQGNDLVFGGAGNDLLICGEGEGNDTYDGGVGIDTVKFTSALAAITVDLSEGTVFSTDGNDAAGIGIDTLIDIENILAGNFDDYLIGNASANSIEGGLGNDQLVGGEGTDTLDGGSDSDTAYYSDKSLPIVVALNGAMDTIVAVGGVAEDTIRNIENLIGGYGNDFFTGDAADNIFRGGAGADTLEGGAGADTADYSEKSESVIAILHGSSDTTVTVGGVAEDTIRNIENLIGGSGDDQLIGDAAANRLSGNVGNDTFEGGAGSDTIIGGFGDDTVLFSGNLADYLFLYDHVAESYTITDSVAGRDGVDIVTGVEHFQFVDVTRDVVTLLDVVAPSLVGITPTGYANDVPVEGSIVLTFSETVQAGTGSIRLVSGSTIILNIDITDSTQVHIDGRTLTIDPDTNLSFKTQYELQIEPGVLTDQAGNQFAGLSGYEFKTVAGTLELSGSVTYWKNDIAIGGSWNWLKEDGLVQRIAGTEEDGTYAYQGLEVDTYSIQTEKDASADGNAVNAVDALAALKIALGINPNGADGGEVSAYQYLAADVDKNGSVQAVDALNILKMALNIGSAPLREWVIVPESVGSETMGRSNVVWPANEIEVTLDQDRQVDLVGVLMGDVNGSWVA